MATAHAVVRGRLWPAWKRQEQGRRINRDLEIGEGGPEEEGFARPCVPSFCGFFGHLSVFTARQYPDDISDVQCLPLPSAQEIKYVLNE